MRSVSTAALILALGLAGGAAAAPASGMLPPGLDAGVEAEYPKVVAWRRDIHEHPELGNREVRTGKLIADELRRIGLEVRTGVANTGVIGILKGGRPGAVVALRSDMDALPVAEETGLPFASRVTADYGGKSVPVMHACGHDSHIAMLLGAAEIMSHMKAQIPGTVVFLFQPAEEGVPTGEKGGAPLVVSSGALDAPRPDAIIGLHMMSGPPGRIESRPGPFFAGSDTFHIVFHGKGTHGAMPWAGIDVVSLSASMVLAVNTIAARQVDVTESPTIITIGRLEAGTRFNVIPESAALYGTLRTYGPARRTDVIRRMERTAKDLADSYGATAEVVWEGSNASVDNDAALAAEMGPVLKAVAGPAGYDGDARRRTVSEDFSAYAAKAPIFFYNIGATPGFTSMDAAPANHSPKFMVDEPTMKVGLKTHVATAWAYLQDHAR